MSSMFELLENGQSVEDMFETQTGILTGTDVSSELSCDNIFQIPNSIDLYHRKHWSWGLCTIFGIQ